MKNLYNKMKTKGNKPDESLQTLHIFGRVHTRHDHVLVILRSATWIAFQISQMTVETNQLMLRHYRDPINKCIKHYPIGASQRTRIMCL